MKKIKFYLLTFFAIGFFSLPVISGNISKKDSIVYHKCSIIDSLSNSNDSLFQLELKRFYEFIKPFKKPRYHSYYYRRLGLFYFRQEKYLKAITNYQNSIEITKNSKHPWDLASDYSNMGDIYFKMKEYNQALNLYKKSNLLFEDTKKDYFIKGHYKYQLAATYFELNDINLSLIFGKESVNYLSRTDNITKELNKERTRAEFLINSHILLAKIYLSKKEIDKLDYELDKCLYFINKYKFNNYKPLFDLYQGYSNLNSNIVLNFDKLYANLTTLKEKNHHSIVNKYYKLFKESAVKQNNFKSASRYNDSILVYQQKIFNADKARSISYSQAQFETQKAEFEREKAEIETQKEKRKSLQYLIGLIASLLGIAFVIYIWKTKQKADQSKLKIKDLKISSLLHKNELENLNGILEGQEKERDRIAQDLHDSVGGMLASVKMHFNAIVSNNNFSNDYEENLFNKANTLLDESCTEVRRVAHDLHTAMQKQGGLKTQLINLKNAVKISNKMEISVFYDVDEQLLPSVIEKQLYKITLELMSNTLKHAKATKVNLQIIGHDKEIDFIFEDNGIGFKVEGIERGLGLTSIEKRVTKMGGILQIDSHEKSGSTFIISINLPEL